MNFSVTAKPTTDGVAILAVQGEVDVYTAPRLKEEINQRLEAGVSKLVVDLSEVAYMDSSGLGVLIGALRRARDAGGDLLVASPNPRIARILDVTGLSRIFNVREATDDAVDFFKGAA